MFPSMALSLKRPHNATMTNKVLAFVVSVTVTLVQMQLRIFRVISIRSVSLWHCCEVVIFSQIYSFHEAEINVNVKF